MSTTYRSVSILGCSIPREKLYKKQKMFHEHLYPKDAKFCPECGMKLTDDMIFIGIDRKS